MEETLLDVMYELPSLKNISSCVVDRDAIESRGTPTLIDKNGEIVPIYPEMLQQSA